MSKIKDTKIISTSHHLKTDFVKNDSISKSDKEKLWRLAGNRCSFPRCANELVRSEKDGGMPGEMAHIIAKEKNGPRGKPTLPQAKIDTYNNRILLCPSHHKLVDNNVNEWKIGKLHRMKNDHEHWVSVQLSKGKDLPLSINFKVLQYINLPRLLYEPSLYENLKNSEYFNNFGTIRNLREVAFPGIINIENIVTEFVKNWKPSAISLQDINEEKIGARVNFEANFITKNVPPEHEAYDFKSTGNIEKDPHLYCKIGQHKVYLTIDPRWITTSTAFVAFKSGRTKVSGIGVLAAVDKTTARITPFLLGLPTKPWDEVF